MRIIAGEYRGRTILGPEGNETRPITDRVKQSLFDIVTPLLDGAIAYDCFAGTGSMGLECLSRGAASVMFFEADRSALLRLRKNIDTLKVASRATVVGGDLFKWFAGGAPGGVRATLLFLDPPYRFLREKPDDLRQLSADIAARHLTPDGTLVFRHDAADSLELPGLTRYDQRTYGSMALEFLSPGNIQPPPR